MARISGTAGPSNDDVNKETAVLAKQGKLDGNNKPVEWKIWKVS